jgi:hypothetical protein
MEPTLTLDNDVAAGLEEEVARTGRTLQQLVNEFLRHSLKKSRRSKTAKPFIVRARSLGVRTDLNYDCSNALIEQLEGPLYR